MSFSLFTKIPKPGLQVSQIMDPEKPIVDPLKSNLDYPDLDFPDFSINRTFRLSGLFDYPDFSIIRTFRLSGLFDYPDFSIIRTFRLSGLYSLVPI